MHGIGRKEELERKKAKLSAMREERLHRESAKHVEANASNIPAGPLLRNVDIEGILGGIGLNVSGVERLRHSDLSTSASSPMFGSMVKSRNLPMLTVSELRESSFAPTNDETYSKDTQTTSDNRRETPSLATDTWPETPSIATAGVSKGATSLEWDDDILEADEGDPLTEHEVPRFPIHLEMDNHVNIKEAAKELSEEDKENIMQAATFRGFFLRASQLVEDALEEDRDIFVDYSGADKEDELAKAQHMLTEEKVFFDEIWTANRTVTALDWSIVHPEILLAAYSPQAEDEIVRVRSLNSTPDGVCCLWNLKAKRSNDSSSSTSAASSVPDAVFTCQAPITAAIFSDFHPNLIIGGTYVGHIVIWDTRVNRQTPVQRTAVAGATGHSELIKGLAVTGCQNSNSLVSVSSDGRLCSWSLDMLAKPVETMDMTYNQSKVVIPTSLAFARDFDDSFLVGAQDGSVYGGSRGTSESGITDLYEGHGAPVTSVTIPSANDPLNDASIFLTTSMDCTVKLWTKSERFPLISFEDRSEYFLDCDWSSCHPALFATVDLGGHLDIWNLNLNSEVASPAEPPKEVVEVAAAVANPNAQPNQVVNLGTRAGYEIRNDAEAGIRHPVVSKSLNCMLTASRSAWVPTATTVLSEDVMPNRCKFQKKGSHVAVGDDSGRARIFVVNDKIAMPCPDEWSMLEGVIERLISTAAGQQKSDSFIRDIVFSEM